MPKDRKVRRAGRWDLSTNRMISSFSGCPSRRAASPAGQWEYLICRRPQPRACFLSRRFSRLRSATSSFRLCISRRSPSPHCLLPRWCHPNRFLPFGASLEPMALAPHPGTPSTSCNTVPRRYLRDGKVRQCFPRPSPFQNDPDLLFGRILPPCLRRISRTNFSAGSLDLDFCLICVPSVTTMSQKSLRKAPNLSQEC